MSGLPSRKVRLSLAGEQLALACISMYLLVLLVLLTLHPMGLGDYPANRNAPWLIVRLRR
jgi:hypothetical protein